MKQYIVTEIEKKGKAIVIHCKDSGDLESHEFLLSPKINVGELKIDNIYEFTLNANWINEIKLVLEMDNKEKKEKVSSDSIQKKETKVNDLSKVKVPTPEEIDKKVAERAFKQELKEEGAMIGGLCHDAAQIISMQTNLSTEEAFKEWKDLFVEMYGFIKNGEYRK